MDNFDLRKYLSEGKLLEEDTNPMLNKVLSWLESEVGFREVDLDGIWYGEVYEWESNEVPKDILNHLKSLGPYNSMNFSINEESGYVLYYVPRTNQVWFEFLK